MQSQFLVFGVLFFLAPVSVVDEPAEKLISRLGTFDRTVTEALVRAGEAAVKPLAKVLADENSHPSVRLDAVFILGRIGGEQVVPSLKAALSAKDKAERYWAVRSLGYVGPAARDAVPDLARLLQAQASERRASPERRALIESLRKIGGASQEAVDALVLCMKDKRDDDAAVALTGFGRPGAESLVRLGAKYWSDDRPDNERRYGEVYSVVAWGRFPLSRDTLPVLMKHFKSGDAGLRHVAGRALAGVGSAAVPVLSKYLEDKDPDIRAEAAESLATMNWFADRANERGEKVPQPVLPDDVFPKLRRIYILPDGTVDFRIVRAMMGIDEDRVFSDPELSKLVRDELRNAIEKQVEREKRQKNER